MMETANESAIRFTCKESTPRVGRSGTKRQLFHTSACVFIAFGRVVFLKCKKIPWPIGCLANKCASMFNPIASTCLHLMLASFTLADDRLSTFEDSIKRVLPCTRFIIDVINWAINLLEAMLRALHHVINPLEPMPHININPHSSSTHTGKGFTSKPFSSSAPRSQATKEKDIIMDENCYAHINSSSSEKDNGISPISPSSKEKLQASHEQGCCHEQREEEVEQYKLVNLNAHSAEMFGCLQSERNHDSEDFDNVKDVEDVGMQQPGQLDASMLLVDKYDGHLEDDRYAEESPRKGEIIIQSVRKRGTQAAADPVLGLFDAAWSM